MSNPEPESPSSIPKAGAPGDAAGAGPRRILLIGASSGIGRELAVHLARDGHRLALMARRAHLLEELAASLPGGRELHAAVPGDVALAAECERVVASAAERIGSLDTLIYCAGAARFLPVGETTDALWEEMLGSNLTGLFHAVRAVLPGFRLLHRGHIVALLSVASRQAFPGSSAYTAAKFGALGFLESVRAEVRTEGIHVTAVLPGATDTPLWDRLGDGWDRGRMMRPEQVARLVAAALRETTSGMVEEIRVGPVGGAL